MTKKAKNKNKLREKLTSKYRLVVINEDTFEERFTFKLNRLNVFVFGGFFSILIIVLTSTLIAFTPIKQYIPGYSSTKLKKKATKLVYKTDSLEQIVKLNEVYIDRVKQLLVGKISEVSFNKDSILEVMKYDKDSFNLNPSSEDLAFRKEIEAEDRFSLFNPAVKKAEVVFSAPAEGTLVDAYNPIKKHYAVDLALETGEPVKSVADGTVIFTAWTAQTGHVIIIEHAQGFISVYKHNSTIHKQQGDIVKGGEVIATSGNTGELTTGPHLHFELWNSGYAVNPEDYIDFK